MLFAGSNVWQTDICIKSSEMVDIVLFIGPLILYIGLRSITFTIAHTHTYKVKSCMIISETCLVKLYFHIGLCVIV